MDPPLPSMASNSNYDDCKHNDEHLELHENHSLSQDFNVYPEHRRLEDTISMISDLVLSCDDFHEFKGLLQQRRIQESVSSNNADDMTQSILVNSKDKGQMASDVEVAHLSEDTFSFLIIASVRSFPFFTGIVIVIIKVTMYSLILADMMTKGTPNNALGIPASLEWPVVVSQGLAVAITVITQDDLITSLQLLHVGYSGIGQTFENTTYLKWFCPLFLLFWVGAYGLVVTFLLIITSGEVIDLILNFTAIEFISLLDNIVFRLSSSGFFGTVNRSLTKLVEETSFPVTRSTKAVPWIQIALLFFSFIGMFCGLLLVVFLQASGAFLPSSIIVQFDDEVIPSLSTYSGEFILEVKGSIFAADRVVYRNVIGDGTIGYCSDLEAWTFGRSRTNYCQNITALSQNPTTRDISLILGQSWYVRIGMDSDRVLPMEGLFSATACSNDLDCGGSERGYCSDFRCFCSDGYFGMRCNYVEADVCETIRVDEQTDAFKGLRRKVSQEYSILRDSDGNLVTVYFHPVYIDAAYNLSNAQSNVDVIVYAGLRWVLSSVVPTTKGLNNYSLNNYFNLSFQVSDKTLGPIEAASEIVRFNTAADEKSAPTSIEWFLPGSSDISEMDPVLGINTVFVCSKCGPLYPCAFGNECDDGKCICKNGEKGSLCQVIPVGDGRCDRFFNQREFDYDGGDCCEGSCKSGPMYTCGIMEENSLDSIPIGFPFCKDPSYGCEFSSTDCWSQKSNPIPLLIGESSDAFVLLSSNGRTLVISEPELDSVRVFDQVDADWVQRGQTLEGEGKSRFGSLVALATLPGPVYRRRTGRVPVMLAVAAVGNETNYVEVYSFDPHATIWSRVGQPLTMKETIDSISIGGQGSKLSLAIGLRKSNRAYIYRQDGALNWKLAFNTSGSGVALSGNGHIVACISTDPPIESQGSGLFHLSDLGLPETYDLDVVNNLSLNNMLPFGTYNFAFQSRPVTAVVDYFGEFGIYWGQMYPGQYGLQGYSMLGLRVDIENEKSMTDRMVELGFDIFENMTKKDKPILSMSPDTKFVAINSQKTKIELFQIAYPDGAAFSVLQLYSSNTTLPTFQVDGFENKFAISNGGTTMAVIVKDHVEVVQRSSYCNGSDFRLAITLDEEPGAVSWSVDYVGFISGMEIPTQNIASCRNCYDDDPRYTRVVVVEDFCVPLERSKCLQVTFSVPLRQMGDGAGFVALQDGESFSSYKGEKLTKSIKDGGCKQNCSEGTVTFDFIMHFEGDFPKELRSPLRTLWSSLVQPTPALENLVLIQDCISVNEVGAFELIGSGGFGNWTLFIDGNEKMRHTFDIGKSQIFEVYLENTSNIEQNIPSHCINDECPVCSVCPVGMAVDLVTVDIGGFIGIPCSDLESMGPMGQINPEFCSLYPKNISKLCGCRLISCLQQETTMKVEIEFDNFPQDIEFTVSGLQKKTLWKLDFQNSVELKNQKAAFQSCVPNSGPLFFSIRDRKQNGLCCNTPTDQFFLPSGNRGYNVYLDDVLVGSRRFTFGSKQELNFRYGSKSSQVTVFQPLMWCPDCERCKVCPGDSSFDPDEAIEFELYGVVNCTLYATAISMFLYEEFCSEIQDHVASSCACENFQPACSMNETLFTFKALLDDSPHILKLNLRNKQNFTLWSKRGFTGSVGQEKRYQACIPSMERVYVGVVEYCDEDTMCQTTNRSASFEILLNNDLFVRHIITQPKYEFALGNDSI